MTRRQRRLCGLTALVTSLGAAVTGSASTVSAESTKVVDRRACAASYERAQELESTWKLLGARASLLSCARAECGSFLHRECTAALSHLEKEIPSIVLLARDESGASLTAVGVTMDGAALASRADGRALPIDPGLHQFTFKSPNRPLENVSVSVAQGERNHIVAVAFRKSRHEIKSAAAPETFQRKTAPAVADPRPVPIEPSKLAEVPIIKPAADAPRDARASLPPPKTPLPLAEPTPTRVNPLRVTTNRDSVADTGGAGVGPYLLGALGIAGIGGFAVLHTMARAENGRLPECWPSCPESRLNEVRRLYTASNVSLVGGAVALGAAVGWLYFGSKSDGARAASATRRYSVSVEPRPAGMFAAVGGAF